MVIADYHMHSKFSDGKNTIEEMVQAAVKQGMKEMAITDHGFNHVCGIKLSDIQTILTEIERLNKIYPIKILFGLEANLISASGDIDISKDVQKICDVVLLGYHKSFKPKTFKNIFNFFLPNMLHRKKPTKRQISRNTNAYINAINNNKIDILVHLNYAGCIVDLEKIGKFAKEKGVFIELNTKHLEFSGMQMIKLIQTGCNFILSSDAHNTSRVNDNTGGVNMMEKYGIPESRVANWNKLPKFKKELSRK